MSFSSVSIVGAGPAGIGIAIACAAEGLPVSLARSARGSRLESIRARIERRLALCVTLGVIQESDRESIASRIEVIADASRAPDADLVIDAMTCDPRSRRAVLATLESRLSSGAVLATACDGDRLTEIAEVVRRPDQLVGMRFALPVTRSPHVDLAFLPETAPGAIAACRAFVAMLRKTPSERASQPPKIGYREWLSAPPRQALPQAAE